ncbi:hypothetical protein GQ53DRAFT_803699 [Thozetella sp. PMI_491]|nr:hypothetical protein GQ53DRAFT_803699 [Thozetella sp. PMI_491]
MKFNLLALVLSAQAAGTLATVLDAAAYCGDLGVMEAPDTLPNGVMAANIRKCAAHPVAIESVKQDGSRLELRSCDTSTPYGCSKGYCWKRCGASGEWCWTASNKGFGDWWTCTTWEQCHMDQAYSCGENCGTGGPESTGDVQILGGGI